MDAVDRETLSTALPQLIQKTKVNARFKAAIVSAGIFSDETTDYIFKGKGNGEMVFRLVQKLKRRGNNQFLGFLSALRSVGQDNVAELLETLRSEIRIRYAKDTSKAPNVDRKSTGESKASKAKQKEREESRRSADATTSSEKSLSDIRATLRASMPAFPRETELGDIVIVYSYFMEVDNFLDGTTDTLPGQFQNPPADRAAVNDDITRGVPPWTAATICKVFGGRPMYSHQKRHGGVTWVDMQGRVARVMLSIYLMPEETHIMGAFALADVNTGDALAAVLGYYPRKIITRFRKDGPLEKLDPGRTIIDWYKQTPDAHLYIFQQ